MSRETCFGLVNQECAIFVYSCHRLSSEDCFFLESSILCATDSDCSCDHSVLTTTSEVRNTGDALRSSHCKGPPRGCSAALCQQERATYGIHQQRSAFLTLPSKVDSKILVLFHARLRALDVLPLRAYTLRTARKGFSSGAPALAGARSCSPVRRLVGQLPTSAPRTLSP